MPRTTNRADKRPKRTPINRYRDIITTEQRPGFVRRWVNDVIGRLDRFLAAGWTFVEDANMKVGDKGVVDNNQGLGSVVTRNMGGDITAYLMEIEQDLYREDQMAKEAEIAERERAIRNQHGEEGRYGEVSLSRRR